MPNPIAEYIAALLASERLGRQVAHHLIYITRTSTRLLSAARAVSNWSRREA